MKSACVVYGIYHKDTLGYVGLTNNLERRKNRHLNPVWRKPRKVDCWLNSVNKDVEFRILEEIPAGENAEKREGEIRSKLNPIIMA